MSEKTDQDDLVPAGWRFKYEGGPWVVQKNKPDWWVEGKSEAIVEPLFSSSDAGKQDLQDLQNAQARISALEALIARRDAALALNLLFAEQVAEAADIDADETMIKVSISHGGEVITERSWADAMCEARSVMAEMPDGIVTAG